MGLSIVHGIVGDHGGAVRVESTAGEGTRFEVWLPRVAAAAEELDCQATTLRKGTGEKVLFLDDREEIADVAEAMLATLNYTPVVFKDVHRALASFSAAPDRFDLVICDQDMPGMTGVEFVERIRKLAPDIPAILCTGLPSEELERQAAAAGFCEKPLSLAELSTAMRKALGKTSTGQIG